MASRREKPARASVKLGVPGLDALIGAAMGPGSSIALSGPAQSGKTWLAVQFLLAGSTERQALLYVKVSPRKEAHEVLPFAEQLRELEQSGRATIKGERLNRPLAPWLGAWLESAGSDARIVVEPYPIDIVDVGGRPVPARIRERIRAEGPTVVYGDAEYEKLRSGT